MATRNTAAFLSKYELAAVLSARAAEIASGDAITVPNPNTTDPKKIALLEYQSGKLPMKIRRVWPSGKVEVWNLSEFKRA